MRTAKTFSAITLGALLASSALAQTSATEQMIRLYSEPDEYYFFESQKKQVVNYKEERIVRICTGDSQHLVPLKVSFDGQTTEVGEGDCMRIEAKSVSLEPAEPLDPNWTIRAEVETLN